MTASKPPFRIAHLSDLHLTPTDKKGRTEVSLPGKNLHGMNKVFREILKTDDIQESDLILITGDITDVGDRKSWKVFQKALIGAGVENKTLIVAGNHDVCDMDWEIDLVDFIKTLTKQRQKQNLERLKSNLKKINQHDTYPWSEIVDKKDRRVMVIGLDTNHSGHFYLHDNAVGRIGEKQLKKLETILKKHSNESDVKNYIPVKIIALHHSPNLPKYETLVRRGLIKKRSLAGRILGKSEGLITRWSHQIPQKDRRKLRELCLKYRVRLLAHGHMHEAMDRRVNGIRIIGTPATTQPIKSSGNKKKYQYYQCNISGLSNRLLPKLKTSSI